MTWGVTPALRVRNMREALAFYTGKLGFEVIRPDPEEQHCSIGRGEARLMLESPAGGFYSAGYNEAIKQRLGSPSATAFYMEAPDLDELYAKAQESGVTVVDPLANRAWGQAEFTVADPEGNWLTFWRAG